MMGKVKSIINFAGAIKSRYGRIAFLLHVIYSLFKLPAFLFHELCHLIIVMPFADDLKNIDLQLFEINYNTNTLKTMGMRITFQSSRGIAIIASLAPLIGWAIVMVILFPYHYWIGSYFLLAFDMFYLSADDIVCARKNGLNRKVSLFLYRVWYVFAKPRKIYV